MDPETICTDLREAVLRLDPVAARQAAERLVSSGLDPHVGIERGLARGMKEIGEKFRRMEAFLPELILAADVLNSAMEVIRPSIRADGAEERGKGSVVIGSARGDIHEIGRDLVALLLETAGYRVRNLGKDVPVDTFIEEAEKSRADIIGISSLLTTTLMEQKDLIERLAAMGRRDRFRVMVGGGPVTREWAEQIGADGYGADAVEAVSRAGELMSAESRW